MMERVFREIKDTEIRVVSPTMIELKTEEGWVITDADKSFKTETSLIYLPDKKYIKDYICVTSIEPEPIEESLEVMQ